MIDVDKRIDAMLDRWFQDAEACDHTELATEVQELSLYIADLHTKLEVSQTARNRNYELLQASYDLLREAESRMRELRDTLNEVLRRIESSRKARIGAIENTYEPQISVDTVKKWREVCDGQRG